MNNRLMNHQRIGTYYPFNSTENRSVTNFTNCPEIWSNNEVRIEPVDYKTEYMHGIKVYASITVKGPQSITVVLLFLAGIHDRFGPRFSKFFPTEKIEDPE